MCSSDLAKVCNTWSNFNAFKFKAAGARGILRDSCVSAGEGTKHQKDIVLPLSLSDFAKIQPGPVIVHNWPVTRALNSTRNHDFGPEGRGGLGEKF